MLIRELLFVVLGLQNKKLRAIKSRCGLWTKKGKVHSKINEHIKRKLYIWITRHTQVVQSPTSNYCLQVIFDDQTEPQMVPKFLLQVSV